MTMTPRRMRSADGGLEFLNSQASLSVPRNFSDYIPYLQYCLVLLLNVSPNTNVDY